VWIVRDSQVHPSESQLSLRQRGRTRAGEGVTLTMPQLKSEESLNKAGGMDENQQRVQKLLFPGHTCRVALEVKKNQAGGSSRVLSVVSPAEGKSQSESCVFILGKTKLFSSSLQVCYSSLSPFPCPCLFLCLYLYLCLQLCACLCVCMCMSFGVYIRACACASTSVSFPLLPSAFIIAVREIHPLNPGVLWVGWHPSDLHRRRHS